MNTSQSISKLSNLSTNGFIKTSASDGTLIIDSTSYEVPLTFSTGLTRSTNTITVNSTQNITRLSNLTSGFVKSDASGNLSVLAGLTQNDVANITTSSTPTFWSMNLDVTPISTTTNYTNILTIGDNTNIGGGWAKIQLKSHNDSSQGNNSRTWEMSVGGNYNTPGFSAFGTQGVHDLCFIDNGTIKMQYNTGNGFYIVDPIVSNSLTASKLLASDSNKKIVSLDTSTYPSLSELAFVKGTTSNIQTQIDSKQPTITSNSIASNKLVGTDISTVGTITSGTWYGTIISPTYGGTGVNNSSKTITLGGNLITSGAHTTTITSTGTTNVTLPTSGNILSDTSSSLSPTFASITITGSTIVNTLRMNDTPIYLRTGGDLNHGLRICNTTYPFASLGNLDGPVLYGYAAGCLGIMAGGQTSILTWNSTGVSIAGNCNISSTTASLPVVTDSSKNLVSLSYASFKTNLSLTQNDVTNLSTSSSPTFAGVNTAALSLTGSYKVYTNLVSSTPYTIVSTDMIILSHTASVPHLINLPQASTCTSRCLTFQDHGGRAASYNITIMTYTFAENIDGVRTYVINTNYDRVTMVCDGSNWFTI